MHKSIQDKIEEVGFLSFVSILGEGKKRDRPLLGREMVEYYLHIPLWWGWRDDNDSHKVLYNHNIAYGWQVIKGRHVCPKKKKKRESWLNSVGN